MQEFGNKVALVTGTSGIGRATALRLAQGGAQVLALGIDDAANAALADAATRAGLAVRCRHADVAEPADVEAAVQELIAASGGLDILVNAAAIPPLAMRCRPRPRCSPDASRSTSARCT